ncbi:BnaC07g33840D [Brassica napus]|uniref:BnaC07g33840D protein n=1 Tax=Brassica napus TaxID=3708 RepID=A0A078F9D6_BRANA|nr:BnaC07g33840D [Brassica napus]
MSDGVLRLVLSKTCTDPSSCICTLLKMYLLFSLSDLVGLSGDNTDDHAGKVYESNQLENGSLYVRLDMPGVPKDNFAVTVANGIVKVTGQAPSVSHDSAGRFYSGDVAMLSAPVNIPSRRIKTIAKNGVIRLLIPPL